MALFKELKELKEKLKYYEDMVPVNNMGKWRRSVAIESYKKKIAKIEKQIKTVGINISGDFNYTSKLGLLLFENNYKINHFLK